MGHGDADDAERGLTLVQHPDANAEMRQSPSEVRGAVDGVDNPGAGTDAALFSFLTEERICGELPGDAAADQPLDFASASVSNREVP